MSVGRWSPPEHCPPSAALSGDGRVLRLRDPHVEVPRLSPAPMLQPEVELWVRPAASTAFPIHPGVVTTLYDRAQSVLDAAGAAESLDAGERPVLNRELWRISSAVYAPGGGVRAALDRAVEDRVLRPNLTGVTGEGDRLRLIQLAHLAAWAVFKAAIDWCQAER